MNPRLVVLTGASPSEILPLEGEELFTIGRSAENQLRLFDNGVSREHCRIKLEGENFKIEDLNSHNGTFVNDVPVQELLLKHGDRIRVGRTHLVFLTEEEQEMLFSNEVQFDENELVTQSDIHLSIEKLASGLPPELNVLTSIGKALNDSKDAESLQRRLLEIILELIPAERAAIVLLNEELNAPHSVCVMDKQQRTGSPMQISRRVTEQVLKENAALLSNEIAHTNLQTAESLIGLGVKSLLCVPLSLGEITGFIYLDSTRLEFRFTETHLQQMTAIASLTSAALENAQHLESLKLENQLLQTAANIETNMIGESPPIKSLFEMIAKVARTDSTVLIRGESGTGKELVARAIHQNSPRANKPFVSINCAMLNENMLESDLFGHEKGAFTGAVAQRKGKLEQAEGGTIFLDEIGELAPNLQAKLLRVLQEREFERVGGTRPIKSDVRVIAATNRNLEESVKQNTFRDDLFFRLNVVKIKMPPLSERKSDIPLLAQYFVSKYAERCKRHVAGLSRPALAALSGYDFPGNVRELENAIERAVVLGSTDKILLEDLPEEIVESCIIGEKTSPKLYEQFKVAKQQIVLNAIKKANGNYSEAAQELGIHPNNLHRIIRSLEIDKQSIN